MLRTLWTVPIAAGVSDARLSATAVALGEAVAVVSGTARQNGVEGRVVCNGQMGGALQVFWGKGGEDVT